LKIVVVNRENVDFKGIIITAVLEITGAIGGLHDGGIM